MAILAPGRQAMTLRTFQIKVSYASWILSYLEIVTRMRGMEMDKCHVLPVREVQRWIMVKVYSNHSHISTTYKQKSLSCLPILVVSIPYLVVIELENR